MYTYDVSGLSQEAALTYIRDITVHLKTLESALNGKQADLKLWQDRTALAEKSLREDLRSAAQAQSDRIQGEIDTIQREMMEVRTGIDIMRQQLNSPAFASAQARDKAEALLLEMEMIAGKPDTVTPELKTLTVEAELEELKKKL